MGTELTKAEKTADKLDKFRDHLLHRLPLKPSEHETLEKYRKCFAWRCKLFSPQQVSEQADAGIQQEGSLPFRLLLKRETPKPVRFERFVK